MRTNHFAVNTRVMANRLTGVQRYTREILSRLPLAMAEIAPATAMDGVKGHLWEQAVLPRKVNTRLLWSPCNTGPLAYPRQVVTIHDVIPLDHPEWFHWRFATWYRFLLPRLVHRVRHVIAISQYTKTRLMAVTNLPAEKISVVPNGVDDRFSPAWKLQADEVCGKLALPSRHFLLTLGSLEPRKNLRRLLAAWEMALSHLPADIWLVVAGAMGKPIVFANQSGMSALPPRVHLTGYVADENLPGLYAAAKAFACVSEYEGFGLPPLEAMASGVPVLVSNTTSFPEVAGNACILTNPHDVSGIARDVVRILTEHSLAASLAVSGPDRAKQFSWDDAAKQTLIVLKNAARGRV